MSKENTKRRVTAEDFNENDKVVETPMDTTDFTGVKERWITVEDFEKAKKALEKADLYPGNITGWYIPIEMPLGSPTEPAGEFLGGESYPASPEALNPTSEA